MTVQVSTLGPSDDQFGSGRFAVSIEGTSAFTYGVERVTDFDTEAWSDGDLVEQSWCPFGADETVTVVVSLIGVLTITSAVIYPKDSGHTYTISGGVLTIEMLPDTRLWVEVNGDRANVLHLIGLPLKPALAPTSIDWDDVVQPIAAVEGNGQITVTGHGFTGSVDLIFINGGTLPTVTLGTLEVREPIACTVVDANTIQIVGVEFGDEGAGTHSIAPAEWTDEATELRFPAGVSTLCRGFRLGRGTSVYLDAGSVVRGSFDVSNTLGVLGGCAIRGAGGYLDPSAYSYEFVRALDAEDKFEYAAIYGGTGTWGGTYDNTVSGIVCANQPYYFATPCVRYFENVTVISPWGYSTDGLKTQNPVGTGPVGMHRCYAHCGDDVFYFQRGAPVINECFGIASANGVYHGGYFPRDAAGIEGATIINCHAMYIGTAHPTIAVGGSGILKAGVDGLSADTALGTNNVTVTNLKVWGPNAGHLICIGNIPYPYDFPDGNDQAGQLNGWVINGLWAEENSGQLSHIVGLDSANTPHDLTFTDIEIGGVPVYEDNYETLFAVSVYAYDLTWDERPSDVVAPDFIVEDGTALSTANSYATIAAADSYWLHRGNPAVWSAATVAEREDALRQATFYLDQSCSHLWRGVRVTTTQSLSWPRYGAIDGDEGLLYSSALVPFKLRDACTEVAIRKLQGVDLFPDLSAGADSVASSTISIGPMSISETFAGTASTRPRFPIVDALLRGLLTYSANSSMVRLTR